MTVHPPHTGEHLAEETLAAVGGDYAAAAQQLLALPESKQRDHAIAALALWAAFLPVANDNE